MLPIWTCASGHLYEWYFYSKLALACTDLKWLVIEFRFQLFVVGYFPDGFHKIFLYDPVPFSTYGKQA